MRTGGWHRHRSARQAVARAGRERRGTLAVSGLVLAGALLVGLVGLLAGSGAGGSRVAGSAPVMSTVTPGGSGPVAGVRSGEGSRTLLDEARETRLRRCADG